MASQTTPIVVVDTNVVVSGLLYQQSKPGRVLRATAVEILTLAYDQRIFSEYRGVLTRPKFRLAQETVEEWLNIVVQLGIEVQAAPLPIAAERVPDASDLPFAEVAVATKAVALVTGNRSHFSFMSEVGIPVLSPAALLELFPIP